MRLWAFGDSFTEPFHKQTAGQLEYHKWKGYVPKNFLDFLSEKLNIPQFNLGKGGSSNRTILSSVICNMDNFSENDVIIVGWTSLGRFRIVDMAENFFDILGPQTIVQPFEDSPTLRQSLNEYRIIREHPIFFNELIEYMKLLDKSLPNCKILYWTWHNMNTPQYTKKFQDIINFYHSKLVHNGPIEDIITETQGVINDFHYSENAHRILADKLLLKIS